MKRSRHVSLSTDGETQVLNIPQEFTLASNEVVLRKVGSRLIIEPLSEQPLLSLLAELEDISDNFPDLDEGLLPLDDIQL